MKKIFLFLAILLIILFVFLTKDSNLFKKYAGRQEGGLIGNKDYVVGEIMVGFTDNASYSEIVEAIEFENLVYEKTYGFLESTVLVSVVPGQEQAIIEKLGKNRLVSEAVFQAGKNEIKIKFIFGTTKSRAEKVIRQAGLIMKNFFRFSFLKIETPQGEEQYYIDKFKKLSIVKSAGFNHLLRLD